MTSFARYYENRKLIDVSMDEIETLITDSTNKEKIANLIYRRYYERYLKIFFFESSKTEIYEVENASPVEKNVFNTEFKNGFVMMASCCLLIETLSAFIEGDDKTPRGQGNKSFEIIFSKAEQYGNSLHTFSKENFYTVVRCGILHQGETYKSFKIRRTGDLYNKSESAINASLFATELKSFLKSFAGELKTSKWDGELWDNCRIKLRHIVSNAKI